MFRKLLIILTLSCVPISSDAVSDAIDDACNGLWPQKNEKKKCVDHIKLFEVPLPFIKICKEHFKDVDDKWNCIKSGANDIAFKTCQNLKWSPENTLTCLRAGPNNPTAVACKNFSKTETVQVNCLRTGREVAQIAACAEWSSDDNEKLDCLKMDIPAEEIRTCTKRTKKNIEAAKKCLLNYVANREVDFNKEMQAARHEIAAKEKEEKRLNNKRMPASISSK